MNRSSKNIGEIMKRSQKRKYVQIVAWRLAILGSCLPKSKASENTRKIYQTDNSSSTTPMIQVRAPREKQRGGKRELKIRSELKLEKINSRITVRPVKFKIWFQKNIIPEDGKRTEKIRGAATRMPPDNAISDGGDVTVLGKALTSRSGASSSRAGQSKSSTSRSTQRSNLAKFLQKVRQIWPAFG